MSYSVFDPANTGDHTKQPMFFGDSVNVARYERQKYPEFEEFSKKQLGFFWVPAEVKLGQDRVDFMNMAAHEQHIFTSNLEYQILMDSIQGRAPVAVLNPIVSLPEVEHWNTLWSFDETIHSRSYNHMIRQIYRDPSATFDKILQKPEIQERAKQVSRYYNDLHGFNIDREYASRHNEVFGDNAKRQHMAAVILCLYSINALEAIRFYASFACTFLFHKNGRMGGSAKIMRYIARDEALHHSATNTMIGILRDGSEGDEWARMVEDLKPEATRIFIEAVDQELEWCAFLFQHGSMLGMNEQILGNYVKEVARSRMESIGLESPYPAVKHETLPWMREYLVSEGVQGTPQESENTQYLIGQVDQDVDQSFLDDLEL